MPLLFSHPPFVAIGGRTSAILTSIARIAPIVVEPSDVARVPAGAEYWVRLPGTATYDEAAPLLDAGAQRIISSSQALLSHVSPARFVLELAEAVVPSAATLKQTSGVFCKASYASLESLKMLRRSLGGGKTIDAFDIFVSPSDTPTMAQISALIHAEVGLVPALPTSALSASSRAESSAPRLDIAQLFIASLKTDRSDRLYTTVVHGADGQSLGLVYSSLESIAYSLCSPRGHAAYFSRSRNALWVKGATSGAYQQIIVIRRDCDGDAIEFVVEPAVKTGVQSHFCHTGRSASCFGPPSGLARLEVTLLDRKASAPQGSYTARLFSDRTLLDAKIREEADEVCRARSKTELAAEAADLLYFVMARCAADGVSMKDVAAVLDRRADKVTRRKGDAKDQFLATPNGHHQVEAAPQSQSEVRHINGTAPALDKVTTAAAAVTIDEAAPIVPPLYGLTSLTDVQRASLLKRPLMASDEMVGKVKPIIDAVRTLGDSALRDYIGKLDRCVHANTGQWPIVLSAPFDASLMALDDATRVAIDQAFANISAFHQAQMDRESKVLEVETMPGVVCKRMCRAVDRVGLYIPGGTAVLPSTALMLAIPAAIARCSFISIATPPLPDGSVRPEIVYIAHRCGVKQIVRAGGAHAVAALAYGTATVGKVDKVFGPGNQWVTAAKMAVSMDAAAGVGIDMPAGPSEVLVIADATSDPAFVASDLLSQAEHGPDSQVVLLGVNLDHTLLAEIQHQIDTQARALPRVDVVRTCLTKSLLVQCPNLAEAIDFSNAYAPEHLILHLRDAEASLPLIRNAGSVFVGAWSPESCGDYASGTNHTLPTYGYARQYSGVSTSSFLKHITTQALTPEGLDALGPTVVRLAEVEGLEAHANAVRIRLQRRAMA